ncbi:hypothetical protein [Luteolibacter marinus]|uniref:hypothetical protein n=1 Tax=Luteolibacter marinus TaxID=2776705 RepID=UPI00186898B5|nr:hypothetical protein [Luteolibacter marinus]
MRLTALFALLCLSPLAMGQAGGKFSFRTLCFSYVNQVTKVYLTDPKAGTRSEVPLFTDVYSLPAAGSATNGKATFFLTDEVPEKGKTVPSLAPVAVPDSSQVLFVFLPNPGQKDKPYRVMGMADDTSSFPLGTVKLLNLTPAELRFDMGERAGAQGVKVGPGKTVIVDKVKKVNHLNHYDAKILYQLKPGEFTPFYNSRWRAVDAKRDLVIVYLDPVSKQPVVNVYEDTPLPDKPATP